MVMQLFVSVKHAMDTKLFLCDLRMDFNEIVRPSWIRQTHLQVRSAGPAWICLYSADSTYA